MGLLAPAPLLIGNVSLIAAIEAVCLVHLIMCIFFVSNVSSVDTVKVAGVEIAPVFQCMTGAWFLLGIPFVIIGGVGAMYRVGNNLALYSLYLIGTLGVAIMWIAIFVRYGNTCATLQPAIGQQTQASFVCGVSNGMVLFWMLVLIGGILGAIYLVWSMQEYIKNRLETELIRYQEPWQVVSSLADDVAAEHAQAIANGNQMIMARAAGMGPQGFTQAQYSKAQYQSAF
mmetsp:Transcript_29273/g.62212  ORF Transcript_29273/g.62212 Transcript_29273/m.62212 type:complete len:229 (-) Transcript_29273:57-743(-)